MAEVALIKTAAEQQLAAQWHEAKGRLPGAAALRAAAFRRFDALGLPHRRIEEWRYTNLRALLREAKPLAGAPDAAAKARAKDAGHLLADIEARRLVFVDGVFVPEISDLAGIEPGLTIRSLAQALSASDPLVSTHLGNAVAVNEPMLALNTALMGDGAVIHVAKGATVERPLHLVFTASNGRPAAMFTRSLAVIEQGARAMLVESHEGGDDWQNNSALDLFVGDGAHVDHVRIIGGAGMLHVLTLMARVGARARFNNFSFMVGGALVRNQLFVHFAGEGAVASLRGASLLKDRQHADATLLADHVAGGCQSREVFKSILDGESRGVFQGRIIVRPGAQKTDARMLTQALLLSEQAEADNKPELEIYADDVQCGHGATAGALDEDAKFYLMARGLPRKEAEALLAQAFVGEAIEGIEHAGVRDALLGYVVSWLNARG